MIDFTNGKIIKLHRDANMREREVEGLLVDDESVIGSFTSVRDYVVFTDKRIIAVNKQGVTGTKTDFTSLPYKKIIMFSVETAGTLGYDSELQLYFPSVGKVCFEFSGMSDILEVGQAISAYVL